jgi:hypothetical protein
LGQSLELMVSGNSWVDGASTGGIPARGAPSDTRDYYRVKLV